MAPTVRVDDDVYEELKAHAEPFVDTPNTVLRRLLGLSVGSADQAKADQPGDERPTATGLTTVPARREPSAKSTKTSRPNRKTSSKRTRAPAGALLPEESYELPLLMALVGLGGSGPSREVIDRVGAALDGKLTELDRESLKSGGIRWQSRVQFVRLRLIEQGLMLKDTGRGIWAISDLGRERLTNEKAGAA